MDQVELELADVGFRAAGFDIEADAGCGDRGEGVDLFVADGLGLRDWAFVRRTRAGRRVLRSALNLDDVRAFLYRTGSR